MHLTPDMAEAFGDWLELDRIRDALVASRPELADDLALDAGRPLLRVRRPGRGALLVARAAEDSVGRWIVGASGRSEPVLHDVDAPEEVVTLVLEALQHEDSPSQGDPLDAPPRG